MRRTHVVHPLKSDGAILDECCEIPAKVGITRVKGDVSGHRHLLW